VFVWLTRVISGVVVLRPRDTKMLSRQGGAIMFRDSRDVIVPSTKTGGCSQPFFVAGFRIGPRLCGVNEIFCWIAPAFLVAHQAGQTFLTRPTDVPAACTVAPSFMGGRIGKDRTRSGCETLKERDRELQQSSLVRIGMSSVFIDMPRHKESQRNKP
jgi:hypothetical protein